MQPSPEIRYDVACVLSRGQREYQEDAVVADFPINSQTGFAVLSDGMGGHSAGDVASKIVLTEVYSELKLQTGQTKVFRDNVPKILEQAALAANDCIKSHVAQNPNTRGMGATLVAPVILGTRLFWISVGDSPLYLFRDGELQQLNEDHSMAPQIDLMVNTGLLEPEEGARHPDRNCLTSVLAGEDIPHIDCPADPVTLRPGDVVLAASDGVQFLDDDEIEELLREHQAQSSDDIARVLLNELGELADPDQDNISYAVIRILDTTDVEETKPEETGPQHEPVEKPAPETVEPEKELVLTRLLALNPLSVLKRRFFLGEKTS